MHVTYTCSIGNAVNKCVTKFCLFYVDVETSNNLVYSMSTSLCIYVAHVYFFVPEASCSDGQIRLIEGYTENNGRVEICSNQRWETLNYNTWTSYNTMVACFELGFARS